jgi:glyoxylase-like metal-dependent hydrolase (beta-lactamase superfamily II)
MEIKPGVFMISTTFMGGRQLHLVIVRGERLFLLDSGLAGMPKDLIFPYMRQHHLPLEDLAIFASSHAHADHLGGNAEIKAACPTAKLGAHELDVPWIEKHELACIELYDRHKEMQLFPAESRQWILDVCGADTPVDLVWKGGETLDLGGRSLEVVHAPGHTQGNIVFLDRQGGTLFEAETILGGATGEPGKLAVPYYFDVAAYRCTMHHLAALPWDLMVSSHSEPRDRAAGLQAIRQSLDFVDQFEEQLLNCLRDLKRPAPFAEVAKAMASRYGYALDLGLALLIDTHLDYLARTGRAASTCEPAWIAA